ncbi:MAG: alpha/beta fold hydrolase [Aliarcobacter sp.]|nr:alpha/beta fold hydrolase [Aliarcobacter sp.]
MLKKSLLLSSFIIASSLSAATVSKEDCSKKGDNYIYAGNECIQYHKSKGDTEDALNIIVHGTWKEGTNTLARYAPFAENLSLQTDITTVAVALPGYSGSSTNNFKALAHEGAGNLSVKREYIEFLASLVEALKEKYNATKITYIGHSAGCTMGATMTGLNKHLVNNLVCAGGVYNIHEKEQGKDLISMTDVLGNVNKDMKMVLVYGTADDISKPQITIDFYNLAKEKGFNVKLVEAKDAPHLDLDMTDASVNAIVEVVEEE